MNIANLRRFCDAAGDYADWLNKATARFEITRGPRLWMFLAQFAHESKGFTRMEESFVYTDAERLARLFRTRFDTNHDGLISTTEIEYAKRFVCVHHDPERHAKEEKLANILYSGRFGNGDEASGDGWRFRGRGMGITFKANYAAASDAIYGGAKLIAPDTFDDDGIQLTGPALVAEPEGACLASAWFWNAHGCNQLADMNDFDGTTRVLNPAMEGHAERLEWLDIAEEIKP